MALHKLCLAALGLGLAVATTVSASAVAFDSIRDGTTFESSGQWFGAYPTVSNPCGLGFASLASGAVDKIEMSLFVMNGEPPAQYTISLCANASNNTPGTQLWTQTYDWSDHPVTGDATGTAFDVVNGPTLEAGQTYWIVGSAPTPTNPDGGNALAWNPLQGVTVAGRYAGYYSEAWHDAMVLDQSYGLRVTAVPEPTCLAIIGVTSGLLMSRRRAV